MRLSFAQTTLNLRLKQLLTARFFFLFICTSFTISLIWIQLVSSRDHITGNFNESLVQEALINVAKDTRFLEVYRKKGRLFNELKYILLWTEDDFGPFIYFDKGQRTFINNNCSVINCYVTSDRTLFNGDLTTFDAIAFNGRNMRPNDLPNHRLPHQKYIFFMTESADYYPVCSKTFNGFFNWTSTYRLDSDIPFTSILIRNNQGEIVGPNAEIEWPDNFPELDNVSIERLMDKTKAAAWFVSNCSCRSGRNEIVTMLQKALAHYGYNIDVYGKCGSLKCQRNMENNCDSLLERDYFFYMSLENSFAEDYVTEKLLRALQHKVVPITYGGAEYSRYLPPGSYLDARKFQINDLAATMNCLMNTPKLYSQYFRWQSRYSYSDPRALENVCAVCAALNNRYLFERFTTYADFRTWWNPDFRNRCRSYTDG